MSKVKDVTTAEYKSEALEANMPVVVDFYSTWCGPCKMLAPVLDQMAENYEGKARFVKVNAETEPALARGYRIQGVPTLIFLNDGVEVDRIVGLAPPATIAARIDALAGAKV